MKNMNIEEFFEDIEKKLPDMCTDKDLVKLLPGFFKSACSVHRMRALGRSPAYFHMKPHIVYLRKDVVEWLKDRYVTQNNKGTS